jgi:hypothetical protein
MRSSGPNMRLCIIAKGRSLDKDPGLCQLGLRRRFARRLESLESIARDESISAFSPS